MSMTSDEEHVETLKHLRELLTYNFKAELKAIDRAIAVLKREEDHSGSTRARHGS